MTWIDRYGVTLVGVTLAAGFLSGCDRPARGPEPTAHVVIDNDDPQRVQILLDGVRFSLSAEEGARLLSQGQFDASPRVFVRFRGDCARNAAFVREVEAAVRRIGPIPTTCQTRLPR